jgi:hypothetical protein
MLGVLLIGSKALMASVSFAPIAQGQMFWNITLYASITGVPLQKDCG